MDMKRILFTLLVLLPLCACKKGNPVVEPEKDIAFVSIEAFQTKTQVGTNAMPIWGQGDKIAVLGEDSESPSEFTLRSGAGYTCASFEGIKPQGELFIVCHPSTAKCDGITFRGKLETQVSYSLPATPLGTLPLWGRARDLENVKVSSPCGVLQLNLKGSGRLKSVLLDAGRPISDFVMPPGEYEEIRFTITPAEGEVMYFSPSDAIIIEPGAFSMLSVDLNDLL